MTFGKTLYIITNAAALGTIYGLFGALYYEKSDPKKSGFCLNVGIASAITMLSSPFVSNIAEIII